MDRAGVEWFRKRHEPGGDLMRRCSSCVHGEPDGRYPPEYHCTIGLREPCNYDTREECEKWEFNEQRFL